MPTIIQQTSSLLLLSVCLLSPNMLFAQEQKRILKIQEEIWSINIPEAEITQVPEKWQNKSAVVLFEFQEEDYENSTKFMDKYGSRLTLHYSFRRRIKIQDKAALDEFSQFSFLEQTRRSIRHKADRYFFGIKVIKSDGKEIIVNTDEAIAQNEKENRTQSQTKKIAIPNLQVGDILDYFYVSSETEYYYFDENAFLMRRNYPTVFSTLQIKLSHNCRLNARPLNGGPAFEFSKEEKMYIVTGRDLDKLPDLQWHYPFKNIPMIRYKVSVGGFQTEAKSKDIKTSINPEDLESYLVVTKAYKAEFIAPYYYYYQTYKSELKEGKTHLELAEDFYYYVQEYITSSIENMLYEEEEDAHNVKVSSFIKGMAYIFKKGKIPYDMILASPRPLSSIEDIVSRNDLVYGIRAKVKPEQLFFPPSLFRQANEIPSYLEGTYVYSYKPGSIKKERLPVSSFEKNRQFTRIALRLDAEDLSKLRVEQSTQVTGILKDGVYGQIMTPSDVIIPYYKRQGYSLDEDFYKERSKELAAIRKQREAAFNKKREEVLIEEYKTDWKIEEVALKKIQFEGSGVGKVDSLMAYTVQLEAEGISKKAGPNYLLSIGRMIGSQVNIEEKNRVRSYPIEMPCARSYKHEITFEIPEGYSVEGIDKLQYHVDNTTGGFQSEAKINGNTLIVNVFKYYKHHYEEAAKWGEMLEFLDAANAFYNQSILLKRN